MILVLKIPNPKDYNRFSGSEYVHIAGSQLQIGITPRTFHLITKKIPGMSIGTQKKAV